MRRSWKYALADAGIAAALVFLGAFSDGTVSYPAFVAALSATGIVFFTRLQSYTKTLNNKRAMLWRPFTFL